MERGSFSPVDPEQILVQRERRAALQRFLLGGGSCLICITMNIPGAVKRFEAADRTFGLAVSLAENSLEAAGEHIKTKLVSDPPTGMECYILLDSEPRRIKRLMVGLEESCPIGRLFDIDVLDGEERRLSRTELGFEPRSCFLCGSPAMVCRRSGAHTAGELEGYARRLLSVHFTDPAPERIAELALRAVLTEVAASPKPGLVDFSSSGSHRDMDRFTFMASAAALAPWFRRFAEAGRDSGCSAPEELFHLLRGVGRQAEGAMFSATRGVNTHKGLIFSMGLICGVLGRLPEAQWAAEGISSACAAAAAPALSDFKTEPADTHGTQLYRAVGASGIRGEAAAGFPSVFGCGLPALDDALRRGFSLNDSCVVSLLRLMSQVEDTNVLTRGGEAGNTFMHDEAARLYELFSADPDRARPHLYAACQDFRSRNISPGGCADLLAVSLMLRSALHPDNDLNGGNHVSKQA